jgi:hypothetical protein
LLDFLYDFLVIIENLSKESRIKTKEHTNMNRFKPNIINASNQKKEAKITRNCEASVI